MRDRFLGWNDLNDLFGIDRSEPPNGWGELPEFSSDVPPWNKGMVGAQKAWNKGVPHSDKTKEKIRKKAKGRLVSDATRAKMSNSRLGVARPQSSKAISNALKGREFSEEWKKKLSDKAKRPTGRKMSYEQKKKMYEARWGRPYEEMLKDNK